MCINKQKYLPVEGGRDNLNIVLKHYDAIPVLVEGVKRLISETDKLSFSPLCGDRQSIDWIGRELRKVLVDWDGARK